MIDIDIDTHGRQFRIDNFHGSLAQIPRFPFLRSWL